MAIGSLGCKEFGGAVPTGPLSRAAGLSLAALVFLSIACAAWSRPYDSGPDVIYRAPRVEEAYATALSRGRMLNVAPVNPQLAPSRPWDNLGDFCTFPERLRHDAVGAFFAGHVRPPMNRRGIGSVIETARIQGFAMAALNRSIDVQLDNLQRDLPPEGQARFLGPGQRLRTRPATWGDAAAQRAEWAVALHDVADVVRARAATTPEFDANYVALIWSAFECELIAGHGRFLTDLDQSPETIAEERQVRAVDFLRSFAGAPAR